MEGREKDPYSVRQLTISQPHRGCLKLKALEGQPPISLSLLKEECVFQQLSVNVHMVFSILWSLHLNSCRANKHPPGFTLCGVLRSLLILADHPLASLVSSTLEFVNSGSY